MKHIINAVVVLLIASSCKYNNAVAQSTSEALKPPIATFITETLGLTHCESAVYNAKNTIIYASLIGKSEDGDGSIATINLEGKLINAKFISDLNDPKGIAITEDRLYVSDITELVEADLMTGQIIKKHSIEGIQFLNDVAIDSAGNVFVSDTRTSKIYQLDTKGNFSLWLADEDLDNPNGLLVQNKTMYVASWGSQPNGGRVSKIDMTTKSIDTVTTIIGNLDGIRPYDKDRLIISDWRSGNIHLVDDKGNTQQILQVGQSVGDIAYIPEKKLLLLPMNKQSRLLFYRLE
ncbi:SMP-30/gluconolactonase/LRE family protein [Gelidibacter pelagius]|uniref:Sugar lactone lactonase YvrE n=1 Tax=Gelidibacter pelagius TaxID=2819985 RepID=A0ABS3SW60_9FLAO|nr:hypothetical protein [Gelidibacter pelagius]MBO3099954.1 hypothetical protein [Gelidibacter pelagius]